MDANLIRRDGSRSMDGELCEYISGWSGVRAELQNYQKHGHMLEAKCTG